MDSFDAERNRIPGADDTAVTVVDRADGSRDVTIQLEIIEVQQEVFPGRRVLFWVYAPLGGSMTTVARLPSPTLRVEEGDHVKIVLYNTHYFPHTIHFHGINVPFAMDGVPDFSQKAVQPGRRFVYEFVASNPGTYWYHCHVNPAVHTLMGMSGMFIIEPKRPENHFARVIVGAGRILSIAKATAENYQGEYSLVYQDVDDRLNRIALAYTDMREVEMRMHRDYDPTQRKPNIFLLNGYASPYSLTDTPILVKSGEVTKLRILNIGAQSIYFHPHGHRPVLTDVDGAALSAPQQYSRDTFEVGAAQRIDLALHTGDDGRYSAGPGVWMVHDHKQSAETNAGIDGGAMTAIVYDGFMQPNGVPLVAGNLAPMFDSMMNDGHVPSFDPGLFGTDPAHYDKGWPGGPPLGGAFDYPRRPAAPTTLPRLDLIDVHRHKPVADSCTKKPHDSQSVRVMAGTRFARPGEVYGFEPREIHVKPCTAVTVILENSDEIRHEFMIPGLNPLVAIDVLGPGLGQTSFVTPDRDVTLLFHCHISTHERHGMMGLLIVGKGSKLDSVQADGVVMRKGSMLTVAARGGIAENSAPRQQTGKRVHGRGTVISLVAGNRQVIIDAAGIPNYMAAMSMAYTVATAELLKGLSPGAPVEFTVDTESNVIVDIKLLRGVH